MPVDINWTPEVIERVKTQLAEAKAEVEQETLIWQALSEHAEDHYRHLTAAQVKVERLQEVLSDYYNKGEITHGG